MSERTTERTTERIVLPPLEPAVEPAEQVRARASRRIRGIATVFAVALALIGVRGVWLCTWPAGRTLQVAAAQRWDQVTLRARRGEVVDRDGHRLATSVATPNVIVDPFLVTPSEVDALAAKVAAITGAPPSEVAERMRRASRYQRLAQRVRPGVARAIEALDHPALWVEREPRRYYPEESLAAQVIGFVDAASAGREGLEASLDRYLRGESVLLQRRRDRRGLDVDDPSGSAEINKGMDVHLTLDRAVQRIAERALDRVVHDSAPLSATAVVVDVRTGDILAMASVPTFDPNELGADAAPRRNHAVQDAIEPGSVLKPFTVASAIENGRVTADTLIDCEGGAWVIGRSRIHDTHPHGAITVSEVLKVSSNIGAAKLALGLGADLFLDTLHKFGFGVRTGIQLPAERAGILRSAGSIKPIELATTAYGQGITATPLQLAFAMAALGNDGVLMRPRLVSRVVDVHGVPELVQNPSPAGTAVSPATARAVVAMLEGVTEEGGTGTRATVDGYRVAGKTGTAQKVQDGRYGAGRIGSFVGLVPADHPVLSIVVSVDDPTIGSRAGGIVAAPAFSAIAAASLRHLGVPPDPALLADPEAPAPAVVSAPAPVTAVAPVVASSLPDPDPDPATDPAPVWAEDGWTLPDLTGRSLREVVAALGRTDLALAVEGSGEVVAQRPPPGHKAPPSTEVTLVLR